ncbi:MAG: sugar phosphate isomerase/epimerase [Candidatus Latescibacterota bacterium]|nr:sugar phosphate isomerase/epimerase [Candidatus Latescibacterota bacterium]
MIKLGANSVLFAGFDLGTAFKYIACAGYDGIELSAIKGMCEHLELDNWQAQKNQIKELSEEHGLELLSMEEAALDEDRLEKAFAAGAEIGIPVINVGPGGTADVEEDFERQIVLLAKMAERAEAHGVVMCVKAHVGNCIYNTPSTLRAMSEIDSLGFGIDMDPSHIHRAGENPVEALEAVISRVKHVHIRDCAVSEGGPGTPELQACGRGNIDLAGYVAVLHEAGIEVAASLEIIGAKDYELGRVTTIAAESRGYLNACLKKCGAR